MKPTMKLALKQLNNQNGQMTIEMLLIASLLLMGVLALSQTFQSRNVLAGLVEGPQSYIIGMAENGVWRPAKQANQDHPNLHKRHMSLEGEK